MLIGFAHELDVRYLIWIWSSKKRSRLKTWILEASMGRWCFNPGVLLNVPKEWVCSLQRAGPRAPQMFGGRGNETQRDLPVSGEENRGWRSQSVVRSTEGIASRTLDMWIEWQRWKWSMDYGNWPLGSHWWPWMSSSDRVMEGKNLMAAGPGRIGRQEVEKVSVGKPF